MQTFSTLSLFLSLALASVSASPIEKRVGTTLCAAAPDATHSISINIRFPDTGFKETYFGLEEGSNVLVSKASDGSDFTPENVTKFDFYQCKSTYLGTQYDGNYGVLKPSGDSTNCIQTQSGSVTTPDQVMIVAPCSSSEDESQLQQTFKSSNGFLTLTTTALTPNAESHPTFFRLGENDQGALHLIAGNQRPPAFVPTDTGDYEGLTFSD